MTGGGARSAQPGPEAAGAAHAPSGAAANSCVPTTSSSRSFSASSVPGRRGVDEQRLRLALGDERLAVHLDPADLRVDEALALVRRPDGHVVLGPARANSSLRGVQRGDERQPALVAGVRAVAMRRLRRRSCVRRSWSSGSSAPRVAGSVNQR